MIRKSKFLLKYIKINLIYLFEVIRLITIIVPEPWIPSKSNFIEVQSKSRYYKKMISSSKDCYTIQLNNVSDVFMGQNSSKKYLIDIKESLQISKILDLWSKN